MTEATPPFEAAVLGRVNACGGLRSAPALTGDQARARRLARRRAATCRRDTDDRRRLVHIRCAPASQRFSRSVAAAIRSGRRRPAGRGGAFGSGVGRPAPAEADTRDEAAPEAEAPADAGADDLVAA